MNNSQYLPNSKVKNHTLDPDTNYWHHIQPLPMCDPEQSLGNGALCKNSNCIEVFNGLVRITDSTGSQKPAPVPDRHPDDIKTFSYHSRLRLLRYCAKVRMSAYSDIIHACLTYPNSFPKDSGTIKKIFHNFYVQCVFKFPMCSLIWRLEFQQRGAPHYHIIFLFRRKIYNNDLELFRLKLTDLWRNVIKTDDKNFQLHGVRCTRTNDYKYFFSYISKYCAKVNNDVKVDYSGRRWGLSDNIEFEIKRIIIPSNKALRIFKGKLKHWLRCHNRLSVNFDLIFDDSIELQILLDHNIVLELWNETQRDLDIIAPP